MSKHECKVFEDVSRDVATLSVVKQNSDNRAVSASKQSSRQVIRYLDTANLSESLNANPTWKFNETKMGKELTILGPGFINSTWALAYIAGTGLRRVIPCHTSHVINFIGAFDLSEFGYF